MLGLGVTASIRAWSAVGVVSLILPGLLLLIFAIVGVFPNVHLKEGSIDWPKDEEPKPESVDRENEEIAKLRKELKEMSTRLEDYILASGPAPADGLSDEDRLHRMRRGYEDLDRDVTYRYYTGESYDDGISTDELAKTRDRVRADFLKEERRQWAQYTFGMRDTPPEEDP